MLVLPEIFLVDTPFCVLVRKEKVESLLLLLLTDMEEELHDKIAVVCHGKRMGVVHAHKTSKEELGLMMTGALDLSEKYQDKPAGIARDSLFEDNKERES